MVRVKQSKPSSVLPTNDSSLLGEADTSVEFSPDKKRRQRKSTSAIIELNGQENISGQVIFLSSYMCI